MTIRTAILLSVLLLPVTTFAQSTPAAAAAPTLVTVAGEVAKPLKLSADDLKKFPRKTVRAKDHAGKEAEYEGIELSEILKLAGVKQGEQLRGKELALFLVVGAADGYRAVFALAELDPDFTDRSVILADRRDGKPLKDEEGTVRIVVPGEKRQARWVRQVTSLTIKRAE